MVRPDYAIAQEYDWAAEDMAKKGLRGNIGDPLPNFISADVMDAINNDPEAFQQRVRECAYALAMGKLKLTEE